MGTVGSSKSGAWLILRTKSHNSSPLLHQFWPFIFQICLSHKPPNIIDSDYDTETSLFYFTIQSNIVFMSYGLYFQEEVLSNQFILFWICRFQDQLTKHFSLQLGQQRFSFCIWWPLWTKVVVFPGMKTAFPMRTIASCLKDLASKCICFWSEWKKNAIWS